ncbi:MAG TPA: copper resistance protein CopC, partial [Acidothermaceae bacterium]
PASVLLYFSEQIDPSLSEATVSGPGGERVTAPPASARLIQVDLDTNLPGSYRVTWRAVSDVDGHSTSGAFSFTVGQPAGATVANATASVSVTNWAVTVARWIEDLALIVGVGSLFITWLGRRTDALPWVQPELTLVFGVALAAGVVVVAGEAVAAAGISVHGLTAYFTTGLAGTARLVRILLEVAACVAAIRRVYAVLGVILVALVVALATSGHEASSVGAVALDAGHVLSAGVWVGGILAMATLRPPDGWRAGGRALLARFTPWALATFVATIALGVVQAILNVGTWSALVSTTYGRVLIAKSAAVLLLIPLSLVAWRRRSPHLRIEAAISATVVLAASLLSAFPLPVDSGTASNSAVLTSDVGLPHGSDLTIGAQAGQTLVGVTIDPGAPGRNSVTVYVLSADGAAASQSLPVTAVVDGRAMPLQACGDTCRKGTAQLAGSDALSIHVGGAEGGTATVQLPALPARNGTALLDAALARMKDLTSVTMHETLTGGTGLPTDVTDYEEVAPDRLMWTEPGGAAAISVGSLFSARERSGAPFVAQSGHDPVPEPNFSWQYFPAATAVHLMGSALLDGVQTSVVEFFTGEPGTPVWFRFYVDGTDHVVLSDMSAPGHFMTQSFAHFDAPLVINAP